MEYLGLGTRCILFKHFNPFLIGHAQMISYSAKIVPLVHDKEQCLFLGVLEKIFGRRSREKFRQLHLWLSNVSYFTEGTVWMVGKKEFGILAPPFRDD